MVHLSSQIQVDTWLMNSKWTATIILNSNYNPNAFKYQFSFVIFSNTLLKATVCFVRYTWYFLSGTSGKESTCNAGDMGSIPGLGRSPGEGNGYPPQYSGLENSMDCTVHGVTKRHDRVTFTWQKQDYVGVFPTCCSHSFPLWPLPLPLVFVTGFYPDFPPASLLRPCRSLRHSYILGLLLSLTWVIFSDLSWWLLHLDIYPRYFFWVAVLHVL